VQLPPEVAQGHAAVPGVPRQQTPLWQSSFPPQPVLAGQSKPAPPLIPTTTKLVLATVSVTLTLPADPELPLVSNTWL
jgi:hypothetical protein